MRFTRKAIAPALVAGAAALALGACSSTTDPTTGSGGGPSGGAGELRDITIGIIPFQDFYPFLFAEEKGWFEEAGINVEFAHFDGFIDSTQALAAGAIDLAPQEVGTIVPLVENYPDVVFTVPVHVFNNGFAIMVPEGGDLKGYAQLESELGADAALKAAAQQLDGRTVVTTGNTDMELGVYAAAVHVGGLDWNDVNVVDMEANEGLAAFLSGTGDAYIGGIPQRLRALNEGNVELLTGGQMGPGSVPLVGFAATKDAVADPEQYELFLDVFSVWNRVNTYAGQSEENLLELGQFVADELNRTTGAGMVAEDFKTMFNGWQQFPANGAEWKEWYEVFPPTERWAIAKEFFGDVKGVVTNVPDASENVVVDKFIDDYIAKYGDS